MEISFINSSFRNLQFSSPPPLSILHRSTINGASNLHPTNLNLNHYDRFLKTPNSAETQIRNSQFRPSPTTRICSLGNNETSGAATKVMEHDRSLEMKNKAVEILPELRGTSIFLVGMNSTMKTNLGKSLADALRYYYFDSDSLVSEAAGGESAAKNFLESDEKGYRDTETEVLKQLSSMGRLVVCAGDGAVQSSTNLSLLRYGISIWVDVPLDILAAEVMGSGSQGPKTFDEVIYELNKQYEEMRDGYGTADGKVSLQNISYQLGYEDISAVTTEDVAIEVLREIEKLTRVKKMMEAAAKPF